MMEEYIQQQWVLDFFPYFSSWDSTKPNKTSTNLA